MVMLTYSAMFILTISAHRLSAPVAVSRLPKPIYTGHHTLLSAEPSFLQDGFIEDDNQTKRKCVAKVLSLLFHNGWSTTAVGPTLIGSSAVLNCSL